MDENQFKLVARKHLVLLLVWFVGLLTITVLCFEMRYWAENLNGWRSEVVDGLFSIISFISGICALMFGGFIYGWFK